MAHKQTETGATDGIKQKTGLPRSEYPPHSFCFHTICVFNPNIVFSSRLHLSKMTSYSFTIDAHEKLVRLANEILLLEIPSKADLKTGISCQTDDHRQQSSSGEQSQAQLNHRRQDIPTDCNDTNSPNLKLYRKRVLDCFAKSYSEMEQIRQKMLMELSSKAFDQPECQASNRVINPKPGKIYHLSHGADTEDASVIMLCPGSTEVSLAEESAQALENLEVCCRYIPATNSMFCLRDLRHSYPILHCFDAVREVVWVPVEKLT